MTDTITGRILAGRYRVDAFIAGGGMARVYRVWDLKRGVPLAIKVLRQDNADVSESLSQRFHEEAQALAALQHPNIVRFYEMDDDQGLTFIVMDYVEGCTLREQIQARQRSFGREWMLEIFRPICTALNYAHQKGTVHCDVKPGNILISRGGNVLLTDFGIAQHRQAQGDLLPGTPAYMAPEQVLGRSVSARTDVYALGIVLYEMATNGRRPFEGRSAGSATGDQDQIRWEQVNQAPPPPRVYNPALSPALEQVILRCLEKRPAERFESTLDLLNALEQVARAAEPTQPIQQLEPKPSIIETEVKVERPGRRGLGRLWWLVMIAAGLVLMVLALALSIPGGGGQIASSQTYPYLNRCTQFQYRQSPRIDIRECIPSIEVLADGRLRVNFTWTVFSEGGAGLKIESDVGNTNMYLVDDSGNRLNQLQAGGQAAQSVTLYNGNSKNGWFLFPAPDAQARNFIFHDDDNGVQIDALERKW